MRVTRNSKVSRASKRKPALVASAASAVESLAVFVALLTLGALCAWYTFAQGWTLWYGDAEAHLNIARRVMDSRTPAYEQLGTVWLPLPHVLMLPLVRYDWFWRTGMAGVVPAVLCYAIAGLALFAASRRIFDSTAAAVCATLLFALNPNLLYLQSTPMNEAILLACVLGMLYFTVLFASTRSLWAVAGAGLCSGLAALTRYEGWFLMPFVALYFLVAGAEKRWKAAILFCAIAGLAPVYWLAHNQYFNSNALEFFNGPYSAKAIYDRGHPPGSTPFPTVGDWGKALLYYRTAAELCSGAAVLWMGIAGLLAAAWKRAWWPVAMLGLIPVFYVVSLHSDSSGAEIFLPGLWPNNYYNTRYGIGALPLLALAAAAIVAVFPPKARGPIAAVLVVAALVPWLAYPRAENWVVWKESKVNSETRRAWTKLAAEHLASHYKSGDGIFFSFGDLTGVMRTAGIPLRQTLNECNGPADMGARARPDLFLHTKWAIAIAADSTASAIMKVNTAWKMVRNIYVQGGPVIEIYQRTEDDRSIHPRTLREGARRPQ